MPCPGLDAGAARPKISRDFDISLSLVVCAMAQGNSGAEIQNLSESIRSVVFDHVVSYILIIHRIS